MNGAPLLPQHGFPLRLVVPGWYGMASVKWLNRIEALDAALSTASSRSAPTSIAPSAGGPGTPVTHMRVKSLLVPPGIPDCYTRRRMVERGAGRRCTAAPGRAAACRSRGSRSASTAPGSDAQLEPPQGSIAWRGWRCDVGGDARRARAVPAAPPTPTATTQPLEPRWDTGGFGNNAVQRVHVTVR